MKKLTLILSMSVLGVINASQSFKGESHWWQTSNFSELEVIGAPQLSIEKALQHCKSQGHLTCAFVSTKLDRIYSYNGYRHLEFESISRGYTPEEMSAYSLIKLIEEKKSVYNVNALGNLSLDAVKNLALTSAINNCHLNNCGLCIPVSTTFSELNNFREGAYWSTAISQVSCYSREVETSEN